MILVILIIITLVLWVIQKQWKMKRILMLSRKLKNKYTAFPYIGHGYMFLGSSEDFMDSFIKFGREAITSKYGLTSFWLGSEFYSITCDPIIAEVVSKFSLEKAVLTEFSRDILGNGLIFAPVHIWRPRRKILAPTFSQKNLNYFMEIFTEESTVMVDCLESRAGRGTFSIWPYITSYTMDSICRILSTTITSEGHHESEVWHVLSSTIKSSYIEQTALGIEMKIQGEAFHPFVSAFVKYCKLVSTRILQPWWHNDFLYKLLPAYQESQTNKKIIHDFVDNAIRSVRFSLNEQISTNANNKNHVYKTSFMEQLIKLSGGSDGYTDVEIREEILVLVLAGTDTTAVGISFTLVMLSRFLNVQEKAYEEIREIFGDSKRIATLADLSRLKYLEAVIKETLRLYPPVPIIPRRNDEDVNLPSGIILPSGSSTFIHIWGIHRNPNYWGADAEEFNPERFLNESVPPHSAFMPFSCGPRNCLGYKYAMMSLKVVVSTLLRNYRVLPASDVPPEDLTKPLRVEFDIMLKHVDDFQVRLEHRN